MKIRKVEIKNFRGLRHVVLEPTPMTVIIGENGSGKSNLLHALRLLFDPAWRHLTADLDVSDINAAAVEAGENYFEVKVEVGDLAGHPDLRAVFMESLATDAAGDEYVTIKGTFSADDAGELVWGTTVLPPPGSRAQARPFTARMGRMLPLLYLDPVRDAQREGRVVRGSMLSRLLGDIDISPVEDDLGQLLDQANKKLASAPDIQAIQTKLAAHAKAMLPGGRATVELSLSGHETGDLLRTVQVVLGTQPGQPSLPIRRHGTGLQNLILIAMYRHLRDAHEGVYPTLAIEEPEAHLHPHAQRRLLQELKSVGGATLMTTHSPSIASNADPRNIARLQRAGAGTSTLHQLGPGVLSDADASDFEKLIRNGRSDVFFARAALVVEGRSEALALAAFAAALGLDLDRDGVSILDAGGNAYGYVLNILGALGLNVPLVVTFDTDALRHNAGLVQAAKQAGLIDKATAKAAAKGTPDDRCKALETLGWVAVRENFEFEVCDNGYQDIVLDAIKNENRQDLFDQYLKDEGLKPDATATAQFIGRHDKLKIPVARAVADAALALKVVPSCFETALHKVVQLATG